MGQRSGEAANTSTDRNQNSSRLRPSVLKACPVSSVPSAPVPSVPTVHALPATSPYTQCLLLGLGGLFAGVTGPLLSTFIPPLVRDTVGEHRVVIGAVMAIDNVLLLLLVPWGGAASDRATARGRGRLPLVLAGFVMAAAGMALFPSSAVFGIAGLIGAMVVLFTGINVQRSPFQALIADLVPSRDRSLATGSVTFQMCVGAIVFLMLGRTLGMRPAFLIAAATVVVIAIAFALGLREPAIRQSHAAQTTFKSMIAAISSVVRNEVPGMRAVLTLFEGVATGSYLVAPEYEGASAEAQIVTLD